MSRQDKCVNNKRSTDTEMMKSKSRIHQTAPAIEKPLTGFSTEAPQRLLLH